MYPLETNRDVRNLKGQYSKECARKEAASLADRAIWEKITVGRTGIRWDNVVEKIRKELGRDQEGIPSIEKFWRVQDRVE